MNEDYEEAQEQTERTPPAWENMQDAGISPNWVDFYIATRAAVDAYVAADIPAGDLTSELADAMGYLADACEGLEVDFKDPHEMDSILEMQEREPGEWTIFDAPKEALLDKYPDIPGGFDAPAVEEEKIEDF